MDFKGKVCNTRRSAKPFSSDQKFLLNFIMSTYFGPDVKSDRPRFSAVQRIMAGLQPYTLSDLGPSYVSISLLERLYYYVLRDANSNLVLELKKLHLYLKGNLSLLSTGFDEDSQQFTSFFPLNLHRQIWYPESFRIIKGIVFIDDPVISNMKQEDIDRFRSLSGVKSLKVDINEFLHIQLGHQSSKEGKRNCTNKEHETISNGDCRSMQFQQNNKRKCIYNSPPIPEFAHVFPTKNNGEKDPSKRVCRSAGPALMPLLSIPDIKNCELDNPILLTGTARRGLFGPPVGVLDIGISSVAYLFRVALPGVQKNNSQFSCEVESNGKVHIRGLIGGGRTIRKQSRVFQMKFRQLCSPGPFTLSFNLPGPVDPRLFAPNFRSDGILEAVVIKRKCHG